MTADVGSASLRPIVRMGDLLVRRLLIEAFGAPATDDGLSVADEVVDETQRARREERPNSMAVVDRILAPFRSSVEAENEETVVGDGPALRGREGRE